MTTKRYLLIVASGAMLTGCMTGEKFSQLHPGMSKSQVISLMGNPKGYSQNGNEETIQYPAGRVSGWSYATADFYATFRDGTLLSYGANNVQKGQPPTTILLFPARY